MSSRALCPGSSFPHTPQQAARWIPVTPAGSPGQARPGMTSSSRGLLGLRLLDLALELLAAVGQLLVAGLHQKGVETAATLHRFQRVRTDTQAYLALQR